MRLSFLARRALWGALLVSFALVVAGNAVPSVKLAVGLGDAGYTSTFSPWQYCGRDHTSGASFCAYIRSNSICTEVASRFTTMAAFSVLGELAGLLSGAVLLLEERRFQLPLRNLSLICCCINLFSILVVWSVNVGTLFAHVCGSSTSLSDQGASLGPGFALFLSSFLVVLVATAAYGLSLRIRDAGEGELDVASPTLFNKAEQRGRGDKIEPSPKTGSTRTSNSLGEALAENAAELL